MLKYLVTFGVDMKDIQIFSFWAASKNNRIEILKFFVSIGAGVQEHNLFIPFMCASRDGYLDVVKYLVSFGTIKKNEYWELALNDASEKGHFEVVKFLLSHGATDTSRISERCKAYLVFCEKMKEKIRHRAAKKIYYWIIPKLYAPGSVSAYNLGMKGYQACFGSV